MKHPLLPDASLVKHLKVSGIRLQTTRNRHEMSRSGRWYYSPNGAKWRMANVERRRSYQREYYKRNAARRAYLVIKRREYLARDRARRIANS